RILIGYGDDSVAELGGAHIACENISNISAKAIEDSRLGISPLEKSTRYVYFDKKVNGKYLYYLEPKIMNSKYADEYISTCDSLFDSYSKLINPMKKYLMEKFPKGEESERAYEASIKAKACDILRGFLPASTLTNLGLYGNGRAFEYLIIKLASSELTELNNIANEMYFELMNEIPSFVKRAKGVFGEQHSQFLAESKKNLQKFYDLELNGIPTPKSNEVTLISYDEKALDKIVTASLYPFSELPMQELKKAVALMPQEKKIEVLEKQLSKRQNRRHKPGRAFEYVYYEFDVLMNFASFRDLHRHRILTQQRQNLTVSHGFDTPNEIIEIGEEKNFKEQMHLAAETFYKLRKELKNEAQYVVPFAYKTRFSIVANLRELYHLIELRSTIHGHPDYRRIVLKMLGEIKKIHPDLVKHMKFVDYRQASLERLEAEKRTDKKLEELKRKYGD
ncbi:MAG: FAD-dependent thymidylate synthase, partial [Candidatus Diapherotrites archaeon]